MSAVNGSTAGAQNVAGVPYVGTAVVSNSAGADNTNFAIKLMATNAIADLPVDKKTAQKNYDSALGERNAAMTSGSKGAVSDANSKLDSARIQLARATVADAYKDLKGTPSVKQTAMDAYIKNAHDAAEVANLVRPKTVESLEKAKLLTKISMTADGYDGKHNAIAGEAYSGNSVPSGVAGAGIAYTSSGTGVGAAAAVAAAADAVLLAKLPF